MTKIDKNMMKNFFKVTSLVIVGLVGLSIITQLNRAIVSVNSGTMTVLEATQFLFSEAPRTAVMLMPIAVLLGALMTMNNMAKTSEIIALKTSGISFKRIIKYPVIVAFIFAVITALIADNLSTVGRKVKRELKNKYNKSNAYSKEASSNVYMKGQNNEYISHIGTVYGDFGEIYSAIMIFQDEKGLLTKIIGIESAKYDEFQKIWKGNNVYVRDFIKNTEEKYILKEIPELKEKPMDMIKHVFYMDEVSFNTIRKNAIFIKASGGDVTEFLLEMHKRIAEPLLVFIISFFGFSLGSKFVRGGAAISLAIGIVLGFSTYVIKSLSEAFVSGGHLSPAFGAWLPSIIFTIVSIYTVSEAEY